MKHIQVEEDVKPIALCRATITDADSFVSAALASDCEACRTAAGVIGVREKQWDGSTVGVRPAPQWESDPLPNADAILAYVMERRS